MRRLRRRSKQAFMRSRSFRRRTRKQLAVGREGSTVGSDADSRKDDAGSQDNGGEYVDGDAADCSGMGQIRGPTGRGPLPASDTKDTAVLAYWLPMLGEQSVEEGTGGVRRRSRRSQKTKGHLLTFSPLLTPRTHARRLHAAHWAGGWRRQHHRLVSVALVTSAGLLPAVQV